MENKVDLVAQSAPLTGLPRYSSGTSGYGIRDNSGNVVGDNWFSLTYKIPSVTDSSARVGDYVFQRGKAVVVPNSPTDLLQKYKLAIGGTESPSNPFSLTNVGGGAAIGAGVGAGIGAIVGTLIPGVGNVIGGIIGGAIGGIGGGFNSLNSSAENALKAWREENVKYDSAVDFYRDKDGNLKYKLDYKKMGTGGARSGSGVKEAQNVETAVALGDDGRLKVTVSPIYASTDSFKNLIDWISENYSSLSKDTENLEQVLKEIENGINGEAISYISNMTLYADYANRYANASPEAIVSAYMAEASGYVDPKDMDERDMVVLDNDEAKETTAKDFFDSVLKMNKDERNKLVGHLIDVSSDKDGKYDDSTRAIAYGELKSLYAVSANPKKHKDDKYAGMLDADWIVSLLTHLSPLGLNVADVIHFVTGGNLLNTKQEFLNQDDFASFVGIVGSVYTGAKLFKGASSLLEKGLTKVPGLNKLFAASLEGHEGGASAFIQQNLGNSKALIDAGKASALFKTIKIGTFDLALAGSKSIVSGSDFLTEFGQDFARDAILEVIFSYYDVIKMQNAVSETKVKVYVDPTTGTYKKLPYNEYADIDRIYEGDTGLDDGANEYTFTSIGNSGKPEEFVATSNGPRVYEAAGTANIQRTRAGDEVGVIQSQNGTVVYVNGSAVAISPAGEVQGQIAGPEGPSDGIPALKSGVIYTPSSEVEQQQLETALEKAGVPKDTKVFEAPKTEVESAIAAGKFSKFDSTKVGMAVSNNFFNKNGVLDAMNEMALAKDGDVTGWQNRSQNFISVADNAEREVAAMKNGTYVQSSAKAFEDYDMALGELNYVKKYNPKTDGMYLKALRAIEVAKFHNENKAEKDPRDYEAEAIAKYGPILTSIPEDRAAVLRDFQEKRKIRNQAINESALKSGKIEKENLKNILKSDMNKALGWVPQWAKSQTDEELFNRFFAGSQEKHPYKRWTTEGELVDLEDLMDPVLADNKFLNFVTTNMGMNVMKQNAVEAAQIAGLLVDNTPTSATIRKAKLKTIKNKQEIKDKLPEMLKAKKDEINKKVPSQKQYKEQMQKLIEDSHILGIVSDIVDKVYPRFLAKHADKLKVYSPSELYRGDTNRKGGVKNYTPFEWYAKTYSDNIVHPQKNVRVWVADGSNGYQDLAFELSRYIAKSGWKPKTAEEGARVAGLTNETLRGDSLSKVLNGKIPKIIKDAFDDIGIDGIEIPGHMFPGYKSTNIDGTGIGHQTEVIVFPWVKHTEVVKPNTFNGGKRISNSEKLLKDADLDGYIKQWHDLNQNEYKDLAADKIMSDDILRNAALNQMYENYLMSAPDAHLMFEDFLDADIDLVRWDNYSAKEPGEKFYSQTDKYAAFTFPGSQSEENIKSSFGGISPVETRITIKPRDVVGSFVVDSEAEVIVPRGVVDGVVGSGNTNNLANSAEMLLNKVAEYNKIFGREFDVQSYMNTSFLPNLKDAINQDSIPLAMAVIDQAVVDVAPYSSRSSVYKSQQEAVAEEWRNWAIKKIKFDSAKSVKPLKDFCKEYDIELMKEKRPVAGKVKHALWDKIVNGERLPDSELLNGLTDSFRASLIEEAEKYLKKQTEEVEAKLEESTEEQEEADDEAAARGELAEAKNDNNKELEVEIDWDDAFKAEFGVDIAEIVKQAKLPVDNVKKSFYSALNETALFQTSKKDREELVDLITEDINSETADPYTMGTTERAIGMGGKYPITYYRNGKEYTRFMVYRDKTEKLLAEQTTDLLSDNTIIKNPGIISALASGVARGFRLAMTGWDPSRGPLNWLRDTGRGFTTSEGKSFINAGEQFKSVLSMGNYSPKERDALANRLQDVQNMVAAETYNAAYRNPRKASVQATKDYLSKTGASPFKRFLYTLRHTPGQIFEAPADFFEGATRKRMAASAGAVELRKLQLKEASFEEQLKGMSDAAYYAGREYTANFKRKGKLIGSISKYVAYLSSEYAGLDGMKRAYISNPSAFVKSSTIFLVAYMILLADTLANEKSRKNYYRLSDWDRGNSIVISLSEDSLLTIPLDQELAAFLFPYRRFIETLNGVDPATFFEFMWGTITEPLPIDLSGFSEGGSFNLARGLEKITAQHMPNILTGIQEAATGYDLYYGSDLSVREERLKDYGIYDPQPGDYTTTGKDSLTLRTIANATGIQQWQLQAMVSNYSANVGSYLLNIVDKAFGATEEQQGGKAFTDAIFKSFTSVDQNNAESEFYNGIKQLQQEKRKVVQAIADYNEDVKTASGEKKVELQQKVQKAKDDFGVKVGDFVDKYVSAYEVTGGLSYSQAMQIYYLFRFDDDDTVYQTGSVEEYYNNKTVQQFEKQATALSAPILDKYYKNHIGNIYLDADGNWSRYLSYGAKAMKGSVYGRSEQHMVDLANIIESKDSELSTIRKKIKNARNEAYEAGDWDTRDALGYEFDKMVINAISPYIKEYGAENVLASDTVLDYLAEWFFVPSDFKVTKKGKYVSLGNGGQTEEAFVRPFIKFVFGLPTNYYAQYDAQLNNQSEMGFTE